MPAVVHVLCGPAGCGKTQQLIERYRAVLGQAPLGSALWLGPTHRAVEALRPRLGDGLAPQTFTLQDFADVITYLEGRRERK